MLKTLIVAAGLMATPALMAAPALADDCLRYGETVTLDGRFGAATASADAREVGKPRHADLLLLDLPVCVASDVLSAGVSGATDLQLLCPDLVALDGNPISVTGRLVGSHTGNGQTPVLLVCSFGLKPATGG